MSSLQYLIWWFFFLALMELMRFPVEFYVVKFSSFGYRFDVLWNKEWQEPKLGDAHGTPTYSRTTKSLSLGMSRKASPLSSPSIGNFTWTYIFICHMICVLLGVSCMILVFAFQFTTIILAVHTFWRDTHESEFITILYVLHLYLLS